MHPQLKAYIDVFEQSRRDAHRVAEGLTESQFNWKSSPRTWSVGECLEHLNIIAESYVPLMEAALQNAEPSRSDLFRYGWLSRRFINAVRPGGRRVKTSADLNPSSTEAPSSDLEKTGCLSTFDNWTARFVDIARKSDGLDIARLKITSPFLRLLRLPVGAFLEALGLHALRHVQQAEQVVRSGGFPRPSNPQETGA